MNCSSVLKVSLLLMMSIIVFTTIAPAQNSLPENPMTAVSICGKTGEYSATKNGYAFDFTRLEILSCDFKLIPADTTIDIVSFKVSQFGKYTPYKEYDFSGDSIPNELKRKIFSSAAMVYIEFIKGKIKGRSIIKPLSPLIFDFQ
jgi:hypothetical protein